MRVTWSCAVVALGCLAGATLAHAEQAASAPQRAEAPPFRVGVDLVIVEATAVDKTGAVAKGLGPRDFRVEIGGRARQVESVELVEYDVAGADDDPDVSTNVEGPPSRTVLMVVDQSSLRFENRGVLAGAKRWLAALPAGDRLGFLALPPPGPVVEFTTDHAMVISALDHLSTGLGPSPPPNVQRNVSLWEAFRIMERNDAVRMAVIARECPPRDPTCPAQIAENARALTVEADTRVRPVLAALRDVLRNLVAVPGPKHVVLVSSGWPMDEREIPGQITPLAEEAAAANATLHVFTAEESMTAASQLRVSPRPAQDADLVLASVESLASSTGGRAVRLAGTGESALKALTAGLSGFYRLAVRPAPEDLDGRSKRIEVEVTRSGVSLLGYRRIMAGVKPAAAVESTAAADTAAAVRVAIQSPTPARALGLRATLYTLHGDADPEMVRVLVTAEVSRAAGGPASAVAVLFGPDGKSAAGSEQTVNVPAAGRARISSWLTVKPGAYVLRLAVGDREGRVGTLDRDVYATWQEAGEISTTGLVLLRAIGGAGGALEPVLDVVTQADQLILAGTLSAAPPENGAITFRVVPEVGTATPLRFTGRLGKSSTGAVIAEAAVAPAALPPGKYLVEATIWPAPRRHSAGPSAWSETVISTPMRVVEPDGSSSTRQGRAGPAVAEWRRDSRRGGH